MLLRAEDDSIVGSAGASECACCIVFWVTICISTPVLEEPRVIRRTTAAVRGGAAVSVTAEDGARVVAASRSPQLFRTLSIDVRGAPS